MRPVLFFLLFSYCWCDIQVSVDRTNGTYNVSVSNQIWLRSNHTAIYGDNRWYSSNDSSLSLVHTHLAQGNDPNLGGWNETQLIYTMNRNGTVQNATSYIRQWNAYPAISFHLNTGDQALSNTDLLHSIHVRTIFPSFNIEKIDGNDNRAFFTFEGLKIIIE